MAHSIEGAIAALQAHVGALSGIKAAPTRVPEAMNQYPFATTYLANMRADFASADFAEYLVDFITEIHISRQMLGTAIEAALPYCIALPHRIQADPTLGGAVSNIRSFTCQFGRLEWAKTETIGYRFTWNGKVHLVQP